MQSDITLSLGERTLIIDTKYYSRILQSNFEKVTLRSPHIYQIHSYVTNEDRNHTGRVDGLLLYALTEEGVVPFSARTHDGNILMAQTLNLNVDFVEIKRQLEELVRYAVE
jgi:5-methylcytosine-specific restriction enzyme subunit McrC